MLLICFKGFMVFAFCFVILFLFCSVFFHAFIFFYAKQSAEPRQQKAACVSEKTHTQGSSPTLGPSNAN